MNGKKIHLNGLFYFGVTPIAQVHTLIISILERLRWEYLRFALSVNGFLGSR